jgi:hypothetical protein
MERIYGSDSCEARNQSNALRLAFTSCSPYGLTNRLCGEIRDSGQITSKPEVEHGERGSPGRWLGENVILAGPKYGNIVPRAFTPVLAKHSKSFSLIDCISVGVDRMQRNFEPMRKQVEAWQRFVVTDVTAKVVIYEAFFPGIGQAFACFGGGGLDNVDPGDRRLAPRSGS